MKWFVLYLVKMKKFWRITIGQKFLLLSLWSAESPEEEEKPRIFTDRKLIYPFSSVKIRG